MLRTESVIPNVVGQSVLKHKANLSCDLAAVHSQTDGMAKKITDAEYTKQFLHRTKEAREKAQLTQEKIAKLLDIEQDTLQAIRN